MMFTNKKTNLFKTSVSSNQFVTGAAKISAQTTDHGNGALKYTTSGNEPGNEFLDQFAKITEYRRQRSFDEVSRDMSILWSIDPRKALQLALYIRMITRKVNVDNELPYSTSTVQRGQGLKHEGIMRLMWVAVNHPKVFQDNMWLIPVTGSWKDIFKMMQFDVAYHGWEGRVLDWNMFAEFILTGLSFDQHSELVKKYLPQIRSKSVCKTVEAQANTMIAKFIASKLSSDAKRRAISYEVYRKLKSSGTAHQWQQAISQGKFNELNFGKIHGRALSILTNGKFLSNQGLEEQFDAWINTQETAKFTGYPYELFAPFGDNAYSKQTKRHQRTLIDKQFTTMVNTAKEGVNTDTKFIVVGDSSASMTGLVPGTKVSAYRVMKSLALYFSEFLTGNFANSWIEFNNKPTLHKWIGNTPTEKYINCKASFVGSTDFLSVAGLFCNVKANGVPESEFPTGILCISDGCFNTTSPENNATNFETFLQTLRSAGFSEEFVRGFKLVLWDIPNDYYTNSSSPKFESFGDRENFFYLSGLDGSAISFLLGKAPVEGQESAPVPKTAQELFEAAMDQEILNEIKIF